MLIKCQCTLPASFISMNGCIVKICHVGEYRVPRGRFEKPVRSSDASGTRIPHLQPAPRRPRRLPLPFRHPSHTPIPSHHLEKAAAAAVVASCCNAAGAVRVVPLVLSVDVEGREFTTNKDDDDGAVLPSSSCSASMKATPRSSRCSARQSTLEATTPRRLPSTRRVTSYA